MIVRFGKKLIFSWYSLPCFCIVFTEYKQCWLIYSFIIYLTSKVYIIRNYFLSVLYAYYLDTNNISISQNCISFLKCFCILYNPHSNNDCLLLLNTYYHTTLLLMPECECILVRAWQMIYGLENWYSITVTYTIL